MKRFALLFLAVFAVATAAYANAPSATELMTKGSEQALLEHKNVMVIFHASWCSWCKKLDEFLADPVVGKLMSDNFVIVHLDVLESADKKDLENEGGMEMLEGWHGDKGGIPFTVILTPNGKVLADSNLSSKEGSNIGYPAKPEEIAHFMKMLKSAPTMSPEQSKSIETWLTEHAPKSGTSLSVLKALTFSKNGNLSHWTGDIEIVDRGFHYFADDASFDAAKRTLLLVGHVRLNGPNGTVTTDRAKLDLPG